jgi:hypothetical protein
MTVTNSLYVTEEQFLTYIGKANLTDSELVTWAVATATTSINDHCGRVFSNDDTPSARVFPTAQGCYAEVDDFHTSTGLIVKTDDNDDATFETTWTASEYELEPFNGIVSGLSGFPYWRINATTAQSFPTGGYRRGRLQVTAAWGWAAVPANVFQACLILAQEFHKLRDAPFGIAGVDNWGPMRVRDNLRVAKLLEPYVRHDRTVLVA